MGWSFCYDIEIVGWLSWEVGPVCEMLYLLFRDLRCAPSWDGSALRFFHSVSLCS